MICPSFTASDRAALEAERYLHPHPKVQRKMEAVYLKSLELPHHLICRICQISKPTLGRYLRAFEQAGVEGLKPLGYKGRPNCERRLKMDTPGVTDVTGRGLRVAAPLENPEGCMQLWNSGMRFADGCWLKE
jgi:hypothetical protein